MLDALIREGNSIQSAVPAEYVVSESEEEINGYLHFFFFNYPSDMYSRCCENINTRSTKQSGQLSDVMVLQI